MRTEPNLTSTPTALPQRPQPPGALPKDAAAFWRQIVLCYPPHHFEGANLGLLEQLCRARAFVAQCDRGIARRGLLIKGRLNPLIGARASGWAEVRACCTKLRLAISSTVRAEAAKARPDPRHSLRKPWE
jgi:Phage terminase, small subunit